MLRTIALLALMTLASYTLTLGQSQQQDLEKFQTLSTKNTSEIVVNSTENDFYSFADNHDNASVIVKINVTSETFPDRILMAMMEQGDFNVRYKNSGGKLVISQLKKTQEVRFSGKTHVLDFSYEILVPAAVANKNGSLKSQFCLQTTTQPCPFSQKLPTI